MELVDHATIALLIVIYYHTVVLIKLASGVRTDRATVFATSTALLILTVCIFRGSKRAT